MELLLDKIPGQVILLSIEDKEIGELGPEPLFITQKMIDAVRPRVAHHVRYDISALRGDMHLEEMVFAPSERGAAFYAMPPAAHEGVASELVPVLQGILKGKHLKGLQQAARKSVA